MIYGERVKQVRELQGLTQAELAKTVGVSQSAIAQVESGITQPLPTTLDAIAFATGFPPAFFRQAPSTDFPLGSLTLLYRARASASPKDLDMAHAWALLEWEAAKEMSRQLDDVPVRLPRMPGADPQTAARIVRSELRLGPNAPIERILMPIEKAGVLTLGLPIPIPKLDAFSLWAGDDGRKPVIVLAGEAVWDRLRFSVAHELGHLVLHSPINGAPLELERQADAFSAEFLLPADGIRADLVPPVTLATLIPLKTKWRASIAALVRRARDLNIASESQYHYLMKQLSARGWRTQEPGSSADWAEKPRAFRKMAEVLYDGPRFYDELAAAVRWRPSMAKEVLDAHATVNDLGFIVGGSGVGERPLAGSRPRNS